MIVDGVSIIDGVIQNATVENGPTLPEDQLHAGRMFYLTEEYTHWGTPYSIGLYVFSGSEWRKTSVDDALFAVTAGYGLVGGGTGTETNGVINLYVDPNVVASRNDLNSYIPKNGSVIDIDAGYGLIGGGTAIEAKGSIDIDIDTNVVATKIDLTNYLEKDYGVTDITAGYGLTGGGSGYDHRGDVPLGVDTAVIATQADLKTVKDNSVTQVTTGFGLSGGGKGLGNNGVIPVQVDPNVIATKVDLDDYLLLDDASTTVTAGTGLTGGGTILQGNGAVTLNVDTTYVATKTDLNNYTPATETVTEVTAGFGLSGGGRGADNDNNIPLAVDTNFIATKTDLTNYTTSEYIVTDVTVGTGLTGGGSGLDNSGNIPLAVDTTVIATKADLDQFDSGAVLELNAGYGLTGGGLGSDADGYLTLDVDTNFIATKTDLTNYTESQYVVTDVTPGFGLTGGGSGLDNNGDIPLAIDTATIATKDDLTGYLEVDGGTINGDISINGSLDVNGAEVWTSANFDPNSVSTRVMTTGEGDSSAHWIKIATIVHGQVGWVHSDVSLLLYVVSEESKEYAGALASFLIRQNTSGVPDTLKVEWLGLSGTALSADCFKLVSGGYDSYKEIWMQKSVDVVDFAVYEMARHEEAGIMTIAYNDGGTWQAAEPTGAEEARSSHLTFNGKSVYYEDNLQPTLPSDTSGLPNLKVSDFDLRFGYADQVTRGNTGGSRAMVKEDGVLRINYENDFGNVLIDGAGEIVLDAPLVKVTGDLHENDSRVWTAATFDPSTKSDTGHDHDGVYSQVGHIHTIGNVTGLQAALDVKISLTEKGAANGVATLDANQLIPSTQLPPLAISETFVVANETEMLALIAQRGDVVIRTDESKTYILADSDPTVLANWSEIKTPANVVSVNGHDGVVTLTYVDVGAVPTGRLINGKDLTGDIDLDYGDFAGAQPITMANDVRIQGMNAAGTTEFNLLRVTNSDSIAVGSWSVNLSLNSSTVPQWSSSGGTVDLLHTGGGQTMGGSINMGTHKVTNLGAPTNDADAATKKYVDDAESANIAYADQVLVDAKAYADQAEVDAKTYTDDQVTATSGMFEQNILELHGLKVSRTGDSMTGNLDMTDTATVVNVIDPVAGTDVANKQYVDQEITDLTGYVDQEISLTETYADTAATNAAAPKLNRSGDTMSGNLSMDGNTVTDLGAPTQNTDAATKQYVDAAELDAKQYADGLSNTLDGNKVSKTGDSMSGTLNMSGNRISGVSTPLASGDAATKLYVDTAEADAKTYADGLASTLTTDKVAKSGDTMSGILNMGTNKITNVATPTVNADAATKLYVDTAEADAKTYADGLASTLTTDKVAKSGDTMTGNLNMGGNIISNVGLPTQDAQVATKIYVDSADDAINLSITNLDTNLSGLISDVDDAKVDRAGDTITGDLVVQTKLFVGMDSAVDLLNTGIDNLVVKDGIYSYNLAAEGDSYVGFASGSNYDARFRASPSSKVLNLETRTSGWQMRLDGERLLTETDLETISHRVMKTSSGGIGTAGYWAKLATFDFGTAQHADASVLYYIVNEETSAHGEALISVKVRQGATGTNDYFQIDWLAGTGSSTFTEDSFKLVSDGHGTVKELWMQKVNQYMEFAVYEQAKNIEVGGTITYNNGATWQSVEPTNTNERKSGKLEFLDQEIYHSANLPQSLANATGTANLSVGSFDLVFGHADQSSRGDSGASRAMVKQDGSLHINYQNDFGNLYLSGSSLINLNATQVQVSGDLYEQGSRVWTANTFDPATKAGLSLANTFTDKQVIKVDGSALEIQSADATARFNFGTSSGRMYIAPYYGGEYEWTKEFGFNPGTQSWYSEADFTVSGSKLVVDGSLIDFGNQVSAYAGTDGLTIATSSGTVKIGNENEFYTHYNTDAGTGHHFNKTVQVDGDIRVRDTESLTVASKDGKLYYQGEDLDSRYLHKLTSSAEVIEIAAADVAVEGWYRIVTHAGRLSGKMMIEGGGPNSNQEIEMDVDFSAYSVGGSAAILRNLRYNSPVFEAVRVSAEHSAHGGTIADIHIDVYMSLIDRDVRVTFESLMQTPVLNQVPAMVDEVGAKSVEFDTKIRNSRQFASTDTNPVINAQGAIEAHEIVLDGRTAMRFADSDPWLRINDQAEFTAGTYFGLKPIRTDGDLHVGSSGSMFLVDAATGRVGINDATPQHTLDVAGDARITGDTQISSNLTISGDVIAINGVHGNYTSGVDDNSWGASIWGMGVNYSGGGLGSSYDTASVYGMAWLRSSHTQNNANIGEGLHVLQNGQVRGGIGSNGLYANGTATISGDTNIGGRLYVSDSIQLNNPGIGNTSEINFVATSDTAKIRVTNAASDQTEFQFYMADNPDSSTDKFNWYISSWTGNEKDWKPMEFSGLNAVIQAKDTHFRSRLHIGNQPYIVWEGQKDQYEEVKSGDLTIAFDVKDATTSTLSGYSIEFVDATTFDVWDRQSSVTGANLRQAGIVLVLDTWIDLGAGVKVMFSGTAPVAGDRYRFGVMPSGEIYISNNIGTHVKSPGGTDRLAFKMGDNNVFYVGDHNVPTRINGSSIKFSNDGLTEHDIVHTGGNHVYQLSTGEDVFQVSGTGSGSRLKKITDYGGLMLKADSSIVIYAGDVPDPYLTAEGIDASDGTEKVHLVADGPIVLSPGQQNGYSTDGRVTISDTTATFAGDINTAGHAFVSGNVTVDGAINYEGTGNFVIQSSTVGVDVGIKATADDGSVYTGLFANVSGNTVRGVLAYNNAFAAQATNQGLDIYGANGSGTDIGISHDGSHAYITNAQTGNLHIGTNVDGGNIVIRGRTAAGTAQDAIQVHYDGSDRTQVSIRADAVQRLRVSYDSVRVSGTDLWFDNNQGAAGSMVSGGHFNLVKRNAADETEVGHASLPTVIESSTVPTWNSNEMIHTGGGQTIGGNLSVDGTVTIGSIVYLENNNTAIKSYATDGTTDVHLLRMSAADNALFGDTSFSTVLQSAGAPRWYNGTDFKYLIHDAGGQTIDGQLTVNDTLSLKGSVGIILDNGSGISARNVANTGNVSLITLNAADVVKVGSANHTLDFGSSTTPTWYDGTATYEMFTSKGGQSIAGTTSFQSIRLNNTGDVTLGGSAHAFQIGVSSGANLAVDTNEIQARMNGAATVLHLNHGGGDVRINDNIVYHTGNLNAASIGLGTTDDVQFNQVQVGDEGDLLLTHSSSITPSSGYSKTYATIRQTKSSENLAFMMKGDDSTDRMSWMTDYGSTGTYDERMALIAATGYIGINNPDPTAHLDVGGSAKISGSIGLDTEVNLSQGATNSLRITTANGWVDIGSDNGSTNYAHFRTDRSRFWFEKGAEFNNGIFGYNGGVVTQIADQDGKLFYLGEDLDARYLNVSGGDAAVGNLTVTGSITATADVNAARFTSSELTTGNVQVINPEGTQIFVGNPQTTLRLESDINPSVKIGSTSYTMFHTGRIPEISEVNGLQSALDSKSDDDHHHDADYVNVTGDSMTGDLDVTGNVSATDTVTAGNKVTIGQVELVYNTADNSLDIMAL